MTESDKDDALTKILIHEAVCAERYLGIERRLRTIFRIIAWGGSSLVTGMAFLIWRLAVKDFT